MDCVRPSLRRHRRTGAAGGACTGSAVRLPSRHALDYCGGRIGRRGAGFRDPVRVDPARRQIAGADRARRDWARGRCDCDGDGAADYGDPAGGGGPGGGERAGGQPVGNVYDCGDHADCADHGNLSALRAAGAGAGVQRSGFCAGGSGAGWGTVGFAIRDLRTLVYVDGGDAGVRDHRLRFSG